MNQFLSIQFVSLCLAITALTSVAKSVFDYFIKNKPLLRDVIIPVSNLALSLLVCAIFHIPYMSGLIASVLSVVIVRVVKAKIKSI